jgi:hypothetical protein
MRVEPEQGITPNRWVVVEVKSKNDTFRKILSSWNDEQDNKLSWRASSRIVDETEMKYHYEFTTESGSTYRCAAALEGLTTTTHQIYEAMKASDEVEVNLIPYGDQT